MRPTSEIELSDMIRSGGPFVIRGGDTRRIGHAAGAELQTSGLSGVEVYEPGALTLVARAGTALSEITALLAGEHQRLAFEVPDLRALLERQGVSTLGGVVAANASGPRRVQVGAARDALLGNVTGYDLVKLLAGSHGSLGVLTEVSFKVQALPEAEVTLVSERGLVAGLAALRAALGSPYDISGAGYAQGRAMTRVEGMAGSVAYRAGALEQVMGGDWQRVDGADLWRDLRDVRGFAGMAGAVWRLAVKPTEAARIVGDLGLAALVDWGGGLVWLLDPSGAVDVRTAVAGVGHATLVRPLPGMAAAFPPDAAGVAALTAGLRAKFDPRGILNPGRMG